MADAYPELDDKITVKLLRKHRVALEREAARDGHTSISAVVRKLIDKLADQEKAA